MVLVRTRLFCRFERGVVGVDHELGEALHARHRFPAEFGFGLGGVADE